MGEEALCFQNRTCCTYSSFVSQRNCFHTTNPSTCILVLYLPKFGCKAFEDLRGFTFDLRSSTRSYSNCSRRNFEDVNGWDLKSSRGCVFSPPSLLPVPRRRSEAELGLPTIASFPIHLQKKLERNDTQVPAASYC